MPLVVGMDEAGYGPLLGPLVVGASAWRVQPNVAAENLWTLLEPAVCRTASRRDARLPVGDSKQLFDRKRGLSTLERSVLAFAHAAGLKCDSLANLLQGLGGITGGGTTALPWYHDLSLSLPTDPARSAFTGAAERLATTMAACGATCGGLRIALVTEDAFNRRVAQTHNKASIVVEVVLRLIQWAAGQAGNDELHVYVDRLGGRTDYRKLLMEAFPDRQLHVLAADESCSRYRLAGRPRDWLVQFSVESEEHYLPVALASMVAKYIRELVMGRFNAYWLERAPSLRPTAGYYTDAQRFLEELGPLVRTGGVPTEQFVRAR